ncbi:MAG: hypothetical protein AAFP69_04385, partial [Planctomycetota bacterium]
ATVQAIGLAQFFHGDPATAMDKYRSMQTLFADADSMRPYVMLAQRQIASLQETEGQPMAAADIIMEKLREADRLDGRSEIVQARKIWYSIENLYKGNAAVERLVLIAQERLEKTRPDSNVTPGLGID